MFEATRQERCRNKGEPKDVLLDFYWSILFWRKATFGIFMIWQNWQKRSYLVGRGNLCTHAFPTVKFISCEGGIIEARN